MKPLVVFYSRTGTTKKVGEALADLLQCDSEELIDTKKRKGPLGFLRSGRDATRNKLTVPGTHYSRSSVVRCGRAWYARLERLDVKSDADIYHPQQVEIQPRRFLLHAGGQRE